MLRSPEEALRLAEDLHTEIGAVAQTVVDGNSVLAKTGAGVPDRLTVYAAAAILHSFYTGIEKVLLHVAPALNGGAPQQRAWHRLLLEQMSRPLPGVRPAVLSEDAARALDGYLGFRHRFRNVYGFDLDWAKIRALLEHLDETWALVGKDLGAFEGFVRDLATPA